MLLSLPLLGGAGGGFTSCSDMLDPESDIVMYEENNQLNTVNDTLYSVIGVMHLMGEVADRTNLLGEVRADLVSITDAASEDLKELANFTVSEGNAYNQPKDYYAIINNCNYFIEHADSTYTKQGSKVFERELAAMHSFRAWTYLQLCLNYGDIPFYTDFLGTQLEAEAVLKQPKKSLKEVCNWLIDDLKPWAYTKDLSYVSLNSSFTIPVRLMLGELCLWAERYEEAATWYHDYLTDENDPKPVQNYTTSGWTLEGTELWVTRGNYYHYVEDEEISRIWMEINVLYGTITQLENIYCSTEDNYYYNQLTHSTSATEQSASQAYYLVRTNELNKRDTIRIDVTTTDIANRNNQMLLGDLRLYNIVDIGSVKETGSSNYNTSYYINYKHQTSSYVPLYRLTTVYLHYAEALNRAGYPTAAFAILKYGLCSKTTAERAEGDPISADERAKAGDLITFSDLVFTADNTIGIHARGCGDVDANPEYVIPAGCADTTEWVEDKIVEELSLETIFEGQRYYDLMRVAIRRDDNSYLADPISKRNGKDNPDSELKEKLMDRNNWYLPL